MLDFPWGRPSELLLKALAPRRLGGPARITRLVQDGESAGAQITLNADSVRTSGLEIHGVDKTPNAVANRRQTSRHTSGTPRRHPARSDAVRLADAPALAGALRWRVGTAEPNAVDVLCPGLCSAVHAQRPRTRGASPKFQSFRWFGGLIAFVCGRSGIPRVREMKTPLEIRPIWLLRSIGTKSQAPADHGQDPAQITAHRGRCRLSPTGLARYRR